jgi:hypothetical protein
MEVSGQLHAAAALPPGKEPLVTIGYEAGWVPEPFWTRESNPRTPIVQPVAHACLNFHSDIRLKRSGTTSVRINVTQLRYKPVTFRIQVYLYENVTRSEIKHILRVIHISEGSDKVRIMYSDWLEIRLTWTVERRKEDLKARSVMCASSGGQTLKLFNRKKLPGDSHIPSREFSKRLRSNESFLYMKRWAGGNIRSSATSRNNIWGHIWPHSHINHRTASMEASLYRKNRLEDKRRNWTTRRIV